MIRNSGGESPKPKFSPIFVWNPPILDTFLKRREKKNIPTSIHLVDKYQNSINDDVDRLVITGEFNVYVSGEISISRNFKDLYLFDEHET